MKTALYTQGPGMRATYHRAGIAFPHGVAVALDPAKLGAHAMARIEEDPRLKVSDVDADAVKAAAEAAPAPGGPDGGVGAFRDRILATFARLEAADFTKDGTPKVSAVRAALPEADHEHLAAALVAELWSKRDAPPA